ncbi:hypothetical protein OR16_40974 [Cupriavidus basilensis OR16]|uniref:Uncharacterized protein n=1 Tax=Cupriavidus basilensis OR16 TaxID=1127483 RepID=H1SI80_9BURK|nr:hypothetical protein OR16_40974 [Cupriavidus basilensis OR16]
MRETGWRPDCRVRHGEIIVPANRACRGWIRAHMTRIKEVVRSGKLRCAMQSDFQIIALQGLAHDAQPAQ